ncbi:hypothetical protein JCM8547_003166 [Rhodosporidiobolus lusitaniae]
MNDRQTDELLALSAIYPDTVNWTLLDDAKGVEVRVTLPVEFEEDKDVEVVDWVAPAEPAPALLETVQQVVKEVEKFSVDSQGWEGGEAGRGRRKRGGKGQGKAGPGAPLGLAVDAEPFQPQEGVSGVRDGRGGASAARNGRPAATPAPRTANETPPPPAPSSPPPRTNGTAPPRISFTPRPRSPPPPSAVPPAPPAAEKDDPARPKKLKLRHLPPLELVILLFEAYPEIGGPSSVQIKEGSGWLSEEKKREAEKKLGEVYAGDECLFPLVDLVSSSSPDFLSTFSISFPLVLHQPPPATSSVSPPALSTTLATFNTSSLSHTFSTTSHPCPLCFTSVRGSSCLQLSSCGCTFCTPCLRDYFTLLITEGLVRSVACPATGCVEKRAKWEKEVGGATKEAEREGEKPGRVNGEEVEKLCGKEKRERWEWLKEKVRVESDPTIAFCPLDRCQAAVPKIEDEEKLRICPSCSYSFCQFCRKAWHGARNPCSLPQQSKIVAAYLEGTDSEKQALEARYGGSNIKRLVAAYEEEKAMKEWLEAHATRCPGCDVPVEKSHGCNHMTCGKCATHFCYRCGKSISPTDPYKHYNTPGGRCYGHLFDFNPGQEPPVEEWLGELLDADEAGGH